MPVARRRLAEETILHGVDPPGAPPDAEVPIYAELARRWQAEGRSVPGLPDPVWEALAAPGGEAHSPGSAPG